MGFLGDLLKGFTREVANAEARKLDNEVRDKIKGEIGSLKKEESKYSVPEEYLHFPQFEGVIEDLSTKNEDKYQRCTIDYKANTGDINQYRSVVEANGYNKMTDVRYEKGNEYIIIEDNGSLHLVFHIKK